MKTKNSLSNQILSIVLCLVMVLSMLPVASFTAFAANEYVTVGDFQVKGDASGYTYESNTLIFNQAGEYTVKNTDPATATADNIEIHAENVVLTMAGVNIQRSNPAMELYAGNHIIILAENTVNTLDSSSGTFYAGLLNKEYSVTIRGEGKLVAKGGSMNGAGIGGSNDRGANNGNAGNITIEGGVIEAYGGGNGAGIGGSHSGSVSNITISGGTVTATGGIDGAGIGGGSYGSVSNITISGGTVTAIGGEYGAGIGGGYGATSKGTLSSGVNGSAIVQASSINADTTGFVDYIEKNGTSYTVRGNVTLSADLTIAEGETLTIPENAALTVPEGVTLTNNGTIVNNGTLICNNHNYKNSVCTICGVICTHSFDTDGKCTSCGIQMAAMVFAGGETSFFTDLQQAFNSDAVKSGTADAPATVTLLSDTSTNVDLRIYNAHIILDLNGFNVNGTGEYAYTIMVQYGSITVRGEGTVTGFNALTSYDSVTKVEGGTLKGSYSGISANGDTDYGKGELHISGGTVIGGSSAINYSDLNAFTISGGTFYGKFYDSMGGDSAVQPVITGGSFPEGILIETDSYALSDFLGEDCGYYDANGKKVELAAGQKEIAGYVTVKRDISGAAVTVSDVTYDGTAKEPAVAVKITTADSSSGSAAITLTENVDYTLTYENNINAGTATVTVTGKGNYCGKIMETFTIEKAAPEIGTVTAEVVYDTLEASAVVLNRADMTVNGTLTVNAGQELKLGDNEIAYTFTPADTENYERVTGKVAVTVKDTTAPAVVISGITNGGTYYGQVVFTARDTLAGILSVEIDGIDKTHFEGQYVINPDNQEHTIVATDKAGNKTEYKITVCEIYEITFKHPTFELGFPVNYGVSFNEAYPDTVQDMVAEKDYHTFIGWYESTDGGETLKDTPYDFGVQVTGNVTLYPMFEIYTYTVTYKADGEVVGTVTVEHGADATAPAIPEKEGYTAVWDKDGKAITADTEINAVYTEISATDKPSSPQTGDTTNLWLWVVLLILSSGAIITLAVYDRKKRKGVSSK